MKINKQSKKQYRVYTDALVFKVKARCRRQRAFRIKPPELLVTTSFLVDAIGVKRAAARSDQSADARAASAAQNSAEQCARAGSDADVN